MKLRQKLILKKMMKIKVETIRNVAMNFEVSEKTVRNDIQAINDYLNANHLQTYIKIINSKIKYCSGKEKLEEVEQVNHLSFNDYYVYKMSAKERLLFILLRLLHQHDYTTIQKLSDELFVSRGTINSDLAQLKIWCEEHHVEFQSKKSRGIRIQEDEYKRRKLISLVIRKEDASQKGRDDIAQYERYFKYAKIKEIREIVIACENEEKFYLSDVAFEGLVLHLALAIERSRDEDKNYIYENEVKINYRDDIAYKLAKKVIDKLNVRFSLQLPAEEVRYILFHIVDASQHLHEFEHKEFILLQLMITKLIHQVCLDLHIDVEQDRSLRNGLISHFSVAWKRLKQGEYVENPLKESLFAQYEEIFKVVKKYIMDIQSLLQKEIVIDELSYIVLHFAVAYEKTKEKWLGKPLVLIVCSTGEGTSKIVFNRIKTLFDFEIVGVYSKHLAQSYLKNHFVDLIISTIPMKTRHQCIVVSPMVREDEVLKIQYALLERGFTAIPKRTEIIIDEKTIKKIIREVQTFGSAYTDDALVVNIKTILKEKKDMNTEGKLMLSDVLKKEYIRLNVGAKTWTSAIREAGSTLQKQGVISMSYINATIDNVKDVGPYIVITKGVALPHANNQEGVYKTAISLAVLEDPVNFGNVQNDPVKYVFMLATLNGNAHLQALSDLVSLLEEKSFYHCMNTAIYPQDIVDYIKEFEKNERRI
ncbi:MAG: BglG family transcription antiterminator [Breznakia sp.]